MLCGNHTNDAALAKAQQLADEFKVKAIAYKVNVSDYVAVEKMMKKVVSDFGKIDCFVADAGMAISKAITEQTIDEYKKQMSVNGRTCSGILDVSSILTRQQWTACFTAPNTRAPFSKGKVSATSSLHRVSLRILSMFPLISL